MHTRWGVAARYLIGTAVLRILPVHTYLSNKACNYTFNKTQTITKPRCRYMTVRKTRKRMYTSIMLIKVIYIYVLGVQIVNIFTLWLLEYTQPTNTVGRCTQTVCHVRPV